MGKIKYLPEIMELFKKTPVVTTRDIKLYLKQKGYSYLLLSNLVKQGKIKRITKGFFTIHDDPLTSVFCFRPAYVGLQEALSIHNLWEQETNVVIVTTRKVRIGIHEILGSNVLVHRINPKYFFGFTLLKYGEFFIPVSDVEKTLLDFIYFKQPLSKDTISEIKKNLDVNKLKNYLKVYPKLFHEKLKGFGIKI
jgi:predicted transcriptional regulator of viral defense system